MLKSVLRWPGGKGRVIEPILSRLGSQNPKATSYIEPFAGGAAIAIQVAYRMPKVQQIVINDADKAVAAFWQCVVDPSLRKDLLALIRHTNLNHCLLNLCRVNINSSDCLKRAYSLFILNRTHFSGNITGGTMRDIHSRFNMPELVSRIEGIGNLLEPKTIVTGNDFGQVIAQYGKNPDSIMYLDPPYYLKGPQLYRESFKHKDHVRLAKVLRRVKGAWLLSYDDHPVIQNLYKSWASVGSMKFTYSVSSTGRRPRASELVIQKRPAQYSVHVGFRVGF